MYEHGRDWHFIVHTIPLRSCMPVSFLFLRFSSFLFIIRISFFFHYFFTVSPFLTQVCACYSLIIFFRFHQFSISQFFNRFFSLFSNLLQFCHTGKPSINFNSIQFDLSIWFFCQKKNIQMEYLLFFNKHDLWCFTVTLTNISLDFIGFIENFTLDNWLICSWIFYLASRFRCYSLSIFGMWSYRHNLQITLLFFFGFYFWF